MTEKKEHQPKGMSLSFGDVYEFRNGTNTDIFVITDVGEGEKTWFICAPLIEKDGKDMLLPEGTRGIEFVHKIIGRKTLTQIIKAHEQYWKGNNNLPPSITNKKYIDKFTKNSKKKPRFVPLIQNINISENKKYILPEYLK
ncbi:hypothetical protein ACFL15_00455 [Patescibacteria group bacterium]